MSYHWVLSLQGYTATGGLVSATFHGIYSPSPGKTRQDAYKQVLGDVVNEAAIKSPTVLFWSLEPNDLGGA